MPRHIYPDDTLGHYLCGLVRKEHPPRTAGVSWTPITIEEYDDRRPLRIDGPFCKSCVARIPG